MVRPVWQAIDATCYTGGQPRDTRVDRYWTTTWTESMRSLPFTRASSTIQPDAETLVVQELAKPHEAVPPWNVQEFTLKGNVWLPHAAGLTVAANRICGLSDETVSGVAVTVRVGFEATIARTNSPDEPAKVYAIAL
jgi:hypothetical protein